MRNFYSLVAALVFAAQLFSPLCANAQLSEEEAQQRAEECLAQGCAKTSKLQYRTSSIVSKTSLLKLDRGELRLDDAKLEAELDELNAKRSQNEIRITLNNAVLFAFDEFSLRPEAVLILEKIRGILDYKKIIKAPIRIEGHTDWIGSDSYNQKLSEKRAAAVANWLKEKGISSSRISTSGFGEASPVDTNETDEGRQNNRRVELVVEYSGS
jgi:outer membrane protein OmpA-like peptidoglycan-associated protein